MECCQDYIWLLCIGFVVAFFLAIGIGANDVANTFGTSVGAKVLTLHQACILATIFETLGSILIGAKVSGTIRKGILDPKVFEGNELELMLGYISALLGCCIWLIIATAFGLPVSGTHSIVGSTIGMAVISKGIMVIQWFAILKIAGSWFVSPILSGIVSMIMFLLIRELVLLKKDPLKSGLKLLPIIYTITIFINIGGIIESSPPLLRLELVPWWGKLIIVLIISVTTYLSVLFLLIPFLKKKIGKSTKEENELQVILAVNEKSNDLDEIFKDHPINNLNNKLSLPGDQENTVNLTLENYFRTVNPVGRVSIRKKINKQIDEPSSIPKNIDYSVTNDLKERVISNSNSLSRQGSLSSQTRSIGRFTSIPVENKIPKKFRDLWHEPINNEHDELQKESDNIKENNHIQAIKEPFNISRSDPPDTHKLFSFLQILTAVFGSFAHGGNDVSNAIGPLIGLYLVYKDGKVASESSTPEWILLFGGVGISVGLWILGRRVIKTIGEDLTKITPSSGFVIELASAMTVLGASLLNIPVSSTHCKVGSVVFTGRLRSKESVDWSLFRNIIVAWVVTVPITCLIAAICQIGLKYAFGLPLNFRF